jgi:hypothetical protein
MRMRIMVGGRTVLTARHFLIRQGRNESARDDVRDRDPPRSLVTQMAIGPDALAAGLTPKAREKVVSCQHLITTP